MDSPSNARLAARSYLTSDVFEIEEVGVSTINKTFIVKPSSDNATWFVLQRMHSIFTPDVMINIERVTSFLKTHGMSTPTIMKTQDGASYVEYKNEWWRALSYVPGNTYEAVDDSLNIESVGSLVGRFHNTLMEFTETLPFQIKHFHETEHYIKRLRSVLTDSPYRDEFREHAAFIEQEITPLISMFNHLPKRITHTDLKISNIRFNEGGVAQTLIDLDTLMMHHVAVDLGDGLRSWCALGDEDTPGLAFSKERFDRACSGYFEEATFLTPEERASIAKGVPLIALELAARFMTDACEQVYFVHQPHKYPSLYEQNKNRALNQLSLYRSMKEQGIGAD